MEIWHYFQGQSPPAAILEALSNAGVRHHACEIPPPSGAGIVFFDEITPQLLVLLRDATRRGMERVLAIAPSRAALKPSAIWSLLGTGVSDVFAWDHSHEPARPAVMRLLY